MAESQTEMLMSTGAAPLAAPATLVSSLWPTRTALRAAILTAAGSALLALSAKAQVPFYPVPMTMQTLAVLVLGAAYGWRLGSATVALYLVEGALGLPVFAGPVAGPAYMAGPTGGFLVGFLAAAAATGFMAERGWDRSLPRVVAMMCIGHAVIFAFGLGWLSTLMPFARAWAVGAAPFVWATILKTALAAALIQAAWGFAARSEKVL
jgi:biotin transport system substrate-specific component